MGDWEPDGGGRYTEAQVERMRRSIGHAIPRPGSATLAEDLTTMPRAAKRAGQGVALLRMAEQAHDGR